LPKPPLPISRFILKLKVAALNSSYVKSLNFELSNAPSITLFSPEIGALDIHVEIQAVTIVKQQLYSAESTGDASTDYKCKFYEIGFEALCRDKNGLALRLRLFKNLLA
jgi:hypothetical protein